MLLLNKPGISFTVARLSYKAANFYHRYKNEAKMVEALERLPRVEDRLVFLKKRSYVEQAATILVQEGTLFLCFILFNLITLKIILFLSFSKLF